MIDARRSPAIRSALVALRDADAQLHDDMMAQARDELENAWIPALEARSTNAQDRSVIIKGARAVVGSTGFFMAAAQSEEPLSGGLVPYSNWFAVEMGARTRKATFPQHSKKGKVYTVTKMINRGLPNRQKYGRIAFDAASEIGTKLVGVWVDTILDVYQGAVDRGQ